MHANLLWLRADPPLLDGLLADRGLARLVVARPAPDTCAFRRRDHDRLIACLERLSRLPTEVGRW